MNIESKKYKVQSIGTGLVQIRRKSDGALASASLSELPSTHALAMMKESAFDSVMQQAMYGRRAR